MAIRYTFRKLEAAAETFNKTLANAGSDVRFFAGQRNECSAIDWYKQSDHDKGETSVTNVESDCQGSATAPCRGCITTP